MQAPELVQINDDHTDWWVKDTHLHIWQPYSQETNYHERSAAWEVSTVASYDVPSTYDIETALPTNSSTVDWVAWCERHGLYDHERQDYLRFFDREQALEAIRNILIVDWPGRWSPIEESANG